MIAYPMLIYIPFALILCFSVGIGLKISQLRKNRKAMKSK